MAEKEDAESENAALLESVAQKARHSVDTKREFFETNAQQVVDTARAIAQVYLRDGRLFTMGNGGSSCDAAHIAVEFLHPITAGRPALTAIDLVADTAMMTAVGNDVGFEPCLRAPADRPGAARRRADRHFNQRQFRKSAGGVRQGEGNGRDHRSGWPGWTAARWRRAGLDHCLVVRHRQHPPHPGNATWRSITSSGTWCTRCWPTSAAAWSKERVEP